MSIKLAALAVSLVLLPAATHAIRCTTHAECDSGVAQACTRKDPGGVGTCATCADWNDEIVDDGVIAFSWVIDRCWPSWCSDHGDVFASHAEKECATPTTTTTTPTTTIAPAAGDDPLFTKRSGDAFSVHGDAGEMFNLLSARLLSVNAQFTSVPARVRTDDVTDNVLGRVGMNVCGAAGGLVVERDGSVSFQGEQLGLGEHAVADGASVTVKAHQCDAKMNCRWVAQAEPDLTLTEHRQVVLSQGQLTVTVNVNFLKSPEEVFRFLEVTVDGELGEMHGLLGQGASGADQRAVQVGVFGKQVTAYQGGVQGEGMIEGVYTDYKVADLISPDFAFSAFQCEA